MGPWIQTARSLLGQGISKAGRFAGHYGGIAGRTAIDKGAHALGHLPFSTPSLGGLSIARPSVGGFLGGAFGSVLKGGGWGRASLLKGGLIAGAKFGGAGLLEEMAETPWGQEQSGFSRLLMHTGALGLRVSGVRSLARGAVGSGLSAAGRVQGDAQKYFRDQTRFGVVGQRISRGGFDEGLMPKPVWGTRVTGPSLYDRAMKPLGSVFTEGSLYNRAARLGGKGALFVGRLPFQVALGSPYALGMGVRAGVSGTTFMAGAGLRMAGFKRAGRAMMNSMPSLASLATPTVGGPKWYQAGLRGAGLINQQYHAPVIAGAFGLGAVGMLASKAAIHDRNIRTRRGATTVPIQSRHFGKGMRRSVWGAQPNFGPGLTLALHNNHSRVM